MTGGCQCGMVRFRAESVGRATICHCRMCQKAFGAAFGPLASVKNEDLTWTRGRPKTYRSSNMVTRGFCAECGTPLTYANNPDSTELALGAFDEPDKVAPVLAFQPSQKVAWFGALTSLPSKELQGFEAMVSYQHPDHDTAEWRAPQHD
ncbi:MAG TPA: GFA family protein [Caulobacteraceae bacterium]|nr:GFA family protein [Caulobacteraceae bacterium]